jgi:hypothetical protein
MARDTPAELLSYSTLSPYRPSVGSPYPAVTDLQQTLFSPATQTTYTPSNRTGPIAETAPFISAVEHTPRPTGEYETSKSFESIQPTTVGSPGISIPSTMPTEDLSEKRQILGILYPTTRGELEAGGHVGFGKTRVEVSLKRPCEYLYLV